MSWQLASFVLVFASLALAFWWYERSRPPARVIAVVATLAALAALGRDAFAAVPDVKPITAIVLVSGVAFGAGPGFAIGAISGLASNILLGQGPWTPWQMLGWGLVGLIGAALGRLTRRRLSPLALAVACAASAELFNLVLNLYTWTNTGSHTLAGFGVVLGTAVVFDVTHVVASFGFGLAFGAALLRMLDRVRARMEVHWVAPAPAALALLIAVLTAGVVLTGASPSTATAALSVSTAALPAPARASRLAISREVSFLARDQNADGGFGAGQGQSSSELYSAWVAMGLAAAGRDPLSLRRGGRTVLDALRTQAGSLQGAGDLERTILALHACGASVRALPGGDPVLRLLRSRRPDGSFAGLANITAFGIFALRAAGYSPHSRDVQAAGRWLAAQQDSDGGFGFAARGGGSDVDDTAAAVQALVDTGVRGGPVLRRATAFLARVQGLDGGYPQMPGSASNAQSTAWAVQAIIAAGGDPTRQTRAGSRTPVGYLQSLLAPDGSVRYSRTGAQTPVWVTAQALTALAGKPFPIAPVARASAASSPQQLTGAHAGASASVGLNPPSAHSASSTARPVGGGAGVIHGRWISAARHHGASNGAGMTLAQALTLMLGAVLTPIAW